VPYIGRAAPAVARDDGMTHDFIGNSLGCHWEERPKLDMCPPFLRMIATRPAAVCERALTRLGVQDNVVKDLLGICDAGSEVRSDALNRCRHGRDEQRLVLQAFCKTRDCALLWHCRQACAVCAG
jgi:hypothetical protein